MALGLAAVLVAGVGYLKYQSWRRLTIESAVTEKLNNAPSPTLRQATLKSVCIGHSWSNPGRKSPESRGFSGGRRSGGFGSRRHPCDQSSRVSHFHSGGDFLTGSSGHPGESAESLINQGSAFLDAGDYPAAIECFRKAAADPNNKGAQELLDRAQRAQKTEEELVRKRR
jgi:tetratricopeptide (TPR) repeat protein